MLVSEEVLKIQHAENKEAFVEQLKSRNKNTILENLEIGYVELSLDRVILTMLVGPKTRQPAGILHGGASVVLAETAASIATMLNIDPEKFLPVGMEINANHIRSKTDGIVTATATPFHKGRTTMVWDIKLTDEEDKLICISRCTMAVINKR
jgi:1,4-dihydroxy-2-naphthoyl-CoA hydrolase